MVEINLTLFIQIINFLVLIFILNLLLYKPILKILDSRREQVQKSEDEVKDLNLTIEKRMAEYEATIQKAKLEAMGQRNDILQDGAKISKEILDGARGEISGLMDEFQKKMNAEMEQARQILHQRSKGISMEIAEKVLGRSLQ